MIFFFEMVLKILNIYVNFLLKMIDNIFLPNTKGATFHRTVEESDTSFSRVVFGMQRN